jgi:hypothetical protein
MVSPQAVVTTVVGGLTMYAILLTMPEPVSKGVAALLTLGAMAYLGWDTVWRLIDGWLMLMKEVDRATAFEVRGGGEGSPSVRDAGRRGHGGHTRRVSRSSSHGRSIRSMMASSSGCGWVTTFRKLPPSAGRAVQLTPGFHLAACLSPMMKVPSRSGC